MPGWYYEGWQYFTLFCWESSALAPCQGEICGPVSSWSRPLFRARSVWPAAPWGGGGGRAMALNSPWPALSPKTAHSWSYAYHMNTFLSGCPDQPLIRLEVGCRFGVWVNLCILQKYFKYLFLRISVFVPFHKIPALMLVTCKTRWGSPIGNRLCLC